MRLFPDDAPDAPIIRRDPASRAEDAAAERRGQRLRDPVAAGTEDPPRSFAPAGAPPPNSEPRRTLHLSLPGGDGGQRHDPQPAPLSPPSPSSGERAAPQHLPMHSPTGQAVRHGVGPHPPAGNGAPRRAGSEAPAAREGGAFIDHALRERVDEDIAAFLAAFDAALDHDTAESRTGLREATDRLLRAGARTRIELERLEARVPLASREKGGQEVRAFRPR